MTPAPTTLAPEALATFRRFVRLRSGMAFGPSQAYYMGRRVSERMAACGLDTPGDYLARLERDEAEAQALINSLAVKETYFYREAPQLECLSRVLLSEIAARRGPGERVRLWSAPCATGEEAYSLAIWLLESWRMVDAYHVEIVGSDIDTAALALARDGHYGERALQRLPRSVLDTYFEAPTPKGRRLIADIRESVSFTAANLVDAASMAGEGRFDVIFCRNVLIYFDEAARARAMNNLYAHLAPGGFLCLGHADGLGHTGGWGEADGRLEVRRFPEASVLQRPLG